ncbi:hypothetical protein C8R48DRAFT_728331 [Suillus tomentosus]|nr:hypothetical protein C8R48DRAFT_728331 [Suillus tomentosus]
MTGVYVHLLRDTSHICHSAPRSIDITFTSSTTPPSRRSPTFRCSPQWSAPVTSAIFQPQATLMSIGMSLVKVWSRHLQGFSTLRTCQPIHAVPPILDIPLPQVPVWYLSAVSESGSGHGFLNTSLVNISIIDASFTEREYNWMHFRLILSHSSLQARSSFPMALSAQLDQSYVIIRLFFARRFQRYRHFLPLSLPHKIYSILHFAFAC